MSERVNLRTIAINRLLKGYENGIMGGINERMRSANFDTRSDDPSRCTREDH